MRSLNVRFLNSISSYISTIYNSPFTFPSKIPLFLPHFLYFRIFNQNKKQLNEQRITQMKELKKKHLNSNEQRSMSYQSDTQKLRATKVKEHSSIVDEKLLAERVYYGDQTHVYVGYLRAFKSGYFEGTKIRKITDIAKLLVASENFTKRARGEQKPLTYSTIITELEKVWAIIKQEDTTLIDPYGYDVRINH